MEYKRTPALRRFIRYPPEPKSKAREETSRRKGPLDNVPFSPGRLKRCHRAAALSRPVGVLLARADSAGVHEDAGTQPVESASCRTDAASSTPPDRSPDVESRSFSWRESRGVRKTALFQIYPRGAHLQHVRTVTVGQRADTGAEIDADPSLEDVPRWALDELRSMGREPTTGGAR